MSDDEPKIIVDSDWKQEAQNEKERLSQEYVSDKERRQLPQPSFLEIMNLISMQAVIGLGGMKMPDGREVPADLDTAKHNIDLLEVLQQKTKGRLEETEQKALDATLHELRMAFVQASAAATAPGSSETST